jgi:hypothetical protein
LIGTPLLPDDIKNDVLLNVIAKYHVAVDSIAGKIRRSSGSLRSDKESNPLAMDKKSVSDLEPINI